MELEINPKKEAKKNPGLSGRTDAESVLKDFKKIQDILVDEKKVVKVLKVLGSRAKKLAGDNPEEDAMGRALETILREQEIGAGLDGPKAILFGFVGPEVFRQFGPMGVVFDDLFSFKHGANAHRIQWYVISAFAKKFKHSVAELYRLSLDPDFDVRAPHPTVGGNEQTRTLWDRAVDNTNDLNDARFKKGAKKQQKTFRNAALVTHYLKNGVGGADLKTAFEQLEGNNEQFDARSSRYTDIAPELISPAKDAYPLSHRVEQGGHVWTSFKIEKQDNDQYYFRPGVVFPDTTIEQLDQRNQHPHPAEQPTDQLPLLSDLHK